MTGARPGSSPAEIEATILRLVAARGPGKTICPSEAARAIAGNDPKAWRLLMAPIRHVAVRLMHDGRIAIRRKGRVVEDPEEFRGVYRIGPAED